MRQVIDFIYMILSMLGINRRGNPEQQEVTDLNVNSENGLQRFERLRNLVYEQVEKEIQVGNAQSVKEWASVALQMELSLRQLSGREGFSADTASPLEMLLRTIMSQAELLERQSTPKWKMWWESVDEIVFLYIGLAIGFLTEVFGTIFQPAILLIFGVLILLSVIGYVWWKWTRFLKAE